MGGWGGVNGRITCGWEPLPCWIILLLLLNTNLNFKTDIKGDFPGGPVAKNLPCNARDVSTIPDPERACMPAEKLSPLPQLERPCTTTRDPT